MSPVALVLGFALRQRGNHRRETVDGDEDAADDAGCVEPGQIDFETGGRQRAIEQAEPEAVPGSKQADARYQRVIDPVDPKLRGFRQTMHEDGEGEMRA